MKANHLRQQNADAVRAIRVAMNPELTTWLPCISQEMADREMRAV